MSQARRRLLAFALIALLAAPAAWGRPPLRSGPAPSPGITQTLISLFAGWSGLALPASWFKEGCMLDPFGRCAPKAAPTTKEGCMLDPDGRCGPKVAPDNGCMLDPDGRCSDNATADSGCLLDPFGRCAPIG